MGRVLFRRRRDSQDLHLIPSRPFGRRHTEEDLHRFLETEPSLIARGVGIGEPLPTFVLASHLRLGNGELDLLLLDSDGEITLAELKRGRTPRTVVAQLLDYASEVEADGLGLDGSSDCGVDWDLALEALTSDAEETSELDYDRLRLSIRNPRLLVVAFEIDETTRRITDYLRSRGLPVYCIEFEYFADEECEYYYPELIGADQLQRISRGDETSTQREYRRIWEELLDAFKARKPGVTRSTSSSRSYAQIPVGISAGHLEWAIHGLNRAGGWFEVGLHFESSNRDKNIAALERVREHQHGIQSILDAQLVVEPWGKKYARAYLRRESPMIDEEAKSWALEKMLRFLEALEETKLVDELRDEGW